MSVYPAARYRPLNQFSSQGVKPRLGVILHVNAGDAPSLYGWIAGNNGMSCHWQVAKDGTVEQYVDTDNAAWCQAAGNDQYLSIETQGYPSEALTPAQIRACAGILGWLHATHGIKLALANSPGQPGLGWHGMGGAAWGGHTGCPGDIRKAQRADILRLASPNGDTLMSAEYDKLRQQIGNLAGRIDEANAENARLLRLILNGDPEHPEHESLLSLRADLAKIQADLDALTP